MIVIALCTACFSIGKIKKLWLPYFKIWPLYFECSDAGTVNIPSITKDLCFAKKKEVLPAFQKSNVIY